MTIVFNPPTVDEGPAGGDALFWRYKLARGVSVIQASDGTWSTWRYPTNDQLLTAIRAYRGGYRYEVTTAEAKALVSAGFGAYLTGYSDPIAPSGYGAGPYGSGAYKATVTNVTYGGATFGGVPYGG